MIAEDLIEIACWFEIVEGLTGIAVVLSFAEIDRGLMAGMIDIELMAWYFLSGIAVDQIGIDFILPHFEMDDTSFPKLQSFLSLIGVVERRWSCSNLGLDISELQTDRD